MSPGAVVPGPSAVAAAASPPVLDENAGLSEAAARKIDLTWAVAVVGGIGLLFLLLSLVRGVSVPVMLALAIAYALNPVVGFLQGRGLKRGVATAVVFFALAVTLSGFVLYLIPVFRAEAAKLPEFVEAAGVQVAPWVERTFGIAARPVTASV